MSRSFVSIQKQGGDKTAGILFCWAAALSPAEQAQFDICADQLLQKQRG